MNPVGLVMYSLKNSKAGKQRLRKEKSQSCLFRAVGIDQRATKPRTSLLHPHSYVILCSTVFSKPDFVKSSAYKYIASFVNLPNVKFPGLYNSLQAVSLGRLIQRHNNCHNCASVRMALPKGRALSIIIQ